MTDYGTVPDSAPFIGSELTGYGKVPDTAQVHVS